MGQEIQDSANVVMDSIVTTQTDQDIFSNSDDSITITSRHIPPDKASAIKSEKKFWYADKSFHKEVEVDPDYTPFMERGWVKFLFWVIVIGGFAAALIWYLAESNITLFQKRRKLTEEEKEQDEMPEDIFAINYDRQIRKAVEMGNYRMAIRLQFLNLLKKMADTNIISYRSDRTNLDYLFQVNNKPLYKDFFRLVRHYEYSWYGHFDVDAPVYEKVASDFNDFQQKLGQDA